MYTFAPKQTANHEPNTGHNLSSTKRVSSDHESNLSPSSANNVEAEGFHPGYGPLAPPIGHDFAQTSLFAPRFGRIQRKLTINKPGDEYEQQADRMAEQVTRTAEPQIQRACACGGSCAKWSGDEEPGPASTIQRYASGTGERSEAPPIVSEVLGSAGRPLDRSTSSYMESRFGYDFSKVRVHTDSRAAASAEAIDSRAYTVGTNVVFAKGQFNPASSDGRRLLAHELTHVVQQAQGSGPPHFEPSSPHSAMNIGKASQGLVQRDKPDPQPFVGCTEDNTMVDKPVNQLGLAVKFAADLVDSALAAIERNDSSTNYKVALAKHFRSPDFSDLKVIYRNFRRIFFHLKPENFACASTKDDFDECEKVENSGFDEAFTPAGLGVATGATVLCPVFWFNGLACRAQTLIHESAHAVGIGDGGTHPPNRGSADYPALDGVQPASETAALRKNNPDAYGYFAAQIGRETDTECDQALPDAPISPRDAIKIQGNAPGPPKK